MGAHVRAGPGAPGGRGALPGDGRPGAGADLGGRRRSGRRIFLNAGWQEFTGSGGAEDLEQRAGAAALHPDDEERYLRRGRGRRPRRTVPWEVEYRLRRADGAYHWLLERAAPLGGGTEHARLRGQLHRHQRPLPGEPAAEPARRGQRHARPGRRHRRPARHARPACSSAPRLADACDVRRVGRRRRACTGPRWPPWTPRPRRSSRPCPRRRGTAREALETGRTVVRARPTGRRRSSARATPIPRSCAAGWTRTPSSRCRWSCAGGSSPCSGSAAGPETPAFNADDRALVEEIAGRAALVVDNALLLADERATAQRLTLLQQATAALSAATTPTSVGADRRRGTSPQLLGRTAPSACTRSTRPSASLTLLGRGRRSARRRPGSTIPLTTVRPLTVGRPRAPAPVVRGPRRWSARIPTAIRTWSRTCGRAQLRRGGPPPRRRRCGDRRDRHRLRAPRGGSPRPNGPPSLALAEQCAQALDRARLYRAEQRIAETLQRSLLPQGCPQLARLALAARYLPGAAGTAGRRRLVRRRGARRPPRGDRRRRRRRPGPGRRGRHGAAAQRAVHRAAGRQQPGARRSSCWTASRPRLPGATASTAACLVARLGPRAPSAGPAPGTRRRCSSRRAGSSTSTAPVRHGAGRAGPPPVHRGHRRACSPARSLVLYTDGLVERRERAASTWAWTGWPTRSGGTATGPRRTWPPCCCREILADTDQPDDVALIAARLMPAPLDGRLPADPARLAPRAPRRRGLGATPRRCPRTRSRTSSWPWARRWPTPSSTPTATSRRASAPSRWRGARRRRRRAGRGLRHLASGAGRPRLPRPGPDADPAAGRGRHVEPSPAAARPSASASRPRPAGRGRTPAEPGRGRRRRAAPGSSGGRRAAAGRRARPRLGRGLARAARRAGRRLGDRSTCGVSYLASAGSGCLLEAGERARSAGGHCGCCRPGRIRAARPGAGGLEAIVGESRRGAARPVLGQVTATARPPAEVLLGTAAVAALLVLSPTLWRPTRHVVTIAHEGAHGLVALAAGRRLSGIRLHSDTSGLDRLRRAPHRAWAWCSPAPPGYTGPALFGLGRRRAARRRARRRPAVGAARCCWRCCWCRSATGTACGRCWSPAPWCSAPPGGCRPRARRPSPRWPPGSCCWPRRARSLELQTSRRRRRAPDSDADQLAGLTPLPRACSGSASSCWSTSARCCSAATGCLRLSSAQRLRRRGSQPTGWVTGSTCGAGGMSSTRSVWSTVTCRPWWRMSSGSPSSSR